LRILRVNFADCCSVCTLQLRNPPGHCPSMPMLKNPSGAEPKRILPVRSLGCRFVRSRPDDRLTVILLVFVELDSLTRLNIRVMTFGITIKSLLAVHYRPAQTPSLCICFIWGQILPLTGIKQAIFFPHLLFHIFIREKAAVAETLCQLDGLPKVVSCFSWRVHHLEPLLCSSLGIAKNTFFLYPTC